MSAEINVERAGLGTGQKKGLYKELRENPYLLGLSAVSPSKYTHRWSYSLIVCSLHRSAVSCSVMIKVLSQES
jgi:hypothetical protein